MKLHSKTDIGTEIGQVQFEGDKGWKQIGFSAHLHDEEKIKDGKHGFHIHKKALDEGTTDCTTAEGHYNPKNSTHGSLFSEVRHVGDLGNVIAINGSIETYVWLKTVDYEAPFCLDGEHSIIGKTVVLHAGEDDLGQGVDIGSTKTGNAGSRVACCTLEEYQEQSFVEYLLEFISSKVE